VDDDSEDESEPLIQESPLSSPNIRSTPMELDDSGSDEISSERSREQYLDKYLHDLDKLTELISNSKFVEIDVEIIDGLLINFVII